MSQGAQRTVEIIFSAVDNASSTISSLNQSVGGFAGSVNSATQPLANWHDKILQVNGALLAVAAGGIALATSKAATFEEGFAELLTMFSVAPDNIAGFKEAILSYASSSTLALDDIMGAMYQVGSAGYDYSESIDVMRASEELATAGRATAKESFDLIFGTMKAYGAGVEEATRYSDAFLKTIQLGKTNIPEMSSELAKVTPLAAAMGVSVEELGAFLAVTTQKNMSAAESMTALKGILTGINKPTQSAAKEAEHLGFSLSTAEMRTKGLLPYLAEMSQKTGGSAESFGTLFGNVRAFTGAMAAVGTDGGEMMLGYLQKIRESGGTTAEMVAIMGETFNQGFQTMKTATDVFLVSVGEKFLPSFGVITDGVGDIFRNLGEEIRKGDTLKPIFDILDEVGVDLGEFLKAIARNLPEALNNSKGAINDFANGLGRLIDSIKSVFNALAGADISTVEGLTSAIQKFFGIAENLQAIAAKILESWVPFIQKLGEGIGHFASAEVGVTDFIGALLTGAKILNMFSGAVQSTTGWMSSLGDLATVVIAGKMVGAFGMIQTAAAGIAGVLTAPLAGVIFGGAIGIMLEKEYGIIKGLFDKIAQESELFRRFWEGFTLPFTSQDSKDVEDWGKAFDNTVSRIKQNLDKVPGSIQKLREELAAAGHDLSVFDDEYVIDFAIETDRLQQEELMGFVNELNKNIKPELEMESNKVKLAAFKTELDAIKNVLLTPGIDEPELLSIIAEMERKIDGADTSVDLEADIADVEGSINQLSEYINNEEFKATLEAENSKAIEKINATKAEFDAHSEFIVQMKGKDDELTKKIEEVRERIKGIDSIAKFNFEAETTLLDLSITDTKMKIQDLSGQIKWGVDLDTLDAEEKAQQLRMKEELEALKMKFNADSDSLDSMVSSVLQKTEKIKDKDVKVDAKGDAKKELDDTKKSLDSVKNKDVKIDAKGNASAEIQKIQTATIEIKDIDSVVKMLFDVESAKKVKNEMTNMFSGETVKLDLFDQLRSAGDNSGFMTQQQKFIRDEIVAQKRQQDLRNMLAEQQLKNAVLQHQRMADNGGRSETVITVDGTSVSPHLQAIMFEILKDVQIQAQTDYNSFLLGV